MTAYAAFQNSTKWSFQKWKEEVECNEKAKPRDNNKKAEEANAYFRTLKNQNDVIYRIKGKALRNNMLNENHYK